jgi:hypothetical protein
MEVEEALILGARNTKSVHRLLLKAGIALNALSITHPCPSLHPALNAFIITDKAVAEMKRFTNSSFELYDTNIRPLYNEARIKNRKMMRKQQSNESLQARGLNHLIVPFDRDEIKDSVFYILLK